MIEKLLSEKGDMLLFKIVTIIKKKKFLSLNFFKKIVINDNI